MITLGHGRIDRLCHSTDTTPVMFEALYPSIADKRDTQTCHLFFKGSDDTDRAMGDRENTIPIGSMALTPMSAKKAIKAR